MTFTSSAALVGHLVAALTERRRALGIKQRELDDKAGFTDGLCEKYEAGVRVPSVQALTWWASALGLALTFAESVVPRDIKRAIIAVHIQAGRTQRQIKTLTGASEHTISKVRHCMKVHRSRARKPRNTRKSRDAHAPHGEPSKPPKRDALAYAQ